jgi:gliding motility-associated-like protein
MQLQVGQSAKLSTKASADVTSYTWSPSQWLSCGSCADPVAAPKDNITYMVTVRNAGKCTATDKIAITMLCNDGNVFVPNTFSPNGDGSNDVFYARGSGVNTIRSFKIFNRWGQCVFEKTGVSANNPDFGWDGKLNGVLQPTDVYVYIFDVICANNTLFPIKGNVTLIR